MKSVIDLRPAEPNPFAQESVLQKFNLLKQRIINHSTLHNSLAYHQKQGHIIRIRRGLYYSIPTIKQFQFQQL